MYLVTTPEQAIENIHRYDDDAQLFADLMPRARAWYAIDTEDGWKVAPSKIIGYQDLKPKEYVGRDMHSAPLDGRITESVLQNWADLVEEGDSRYAPLHATLNKLCARFGKKPNSLARISIIRNSADHVIPEANEILVELLAAVFRTLSPAQKSIFRRLSS